MNLHDWIDELSDVLEIETEVDEGLLNDLAELTHDNVDPVAGPVTAYLLGFAAATSAATPETVEKLAARAQTLAENWDRPAGAPDPDDVDDEIPDDRGIDHSSDVVDAELDDDREGVR
ncbi:DUF6457 domain-containing protein [Nocardioides sp. GXZ039]|uniref:DUF6457 domain-containing protein n=1 Tax=Nocardioides sp. GXZ039 TaxID=3136018 RepID=UPI0030F3AC8F